MDALPRAAFSRATIPPPARMVSFMTRGCNSVLMILSLASAAAVRPSSSVPLPFGTSILQLPLLG
jgi:hypothetical protein